MADQNANKIAVQAQVEPTPAAAKTPQPANPTTESGPKGTGTLSSSSPDKTNPDTTGTRPYGATPNADGPEPLTPPTAASTSAEPMESALTEPELWQLDYSILNLLPGEVDDFDRANLDFATALLEDNGEETAEQIAKTYNLEAGTAPESQDCPELELGVDGLDLEDSDSDLEEPPTWESVPAEAASPAKTPACDPVPPPEDMKMSKRDEPLPKQPSLKISDRRVQIKDVGLFRCKTGQPISLRAYPWVEQLPVPLVEGKPQAYTGQDRHDPTGLYPCSTRKERQQAQEAEHRAITCQDPQNPAYHPRNALEHSKYAGETLIRRKDQPWTWDLEAGADHHSMEMCDIMTMTAIRESGLLPHEEGGFNPIMPSYLTIGLAEDRALLTAQEALTLNAAFPYARG